MKMTVEVDCTPAEARAFLGLPDLAPMNEAMVAELQKRMEKNLSMLAPEELMRSWMTLGGQATEQFRNLLTAAATGALTASKAK